jgi:hypothetical protein
MNRTNSKLKKSVYRVLLILLGSSIYWIGYYWFFTRQEGDLLAAGCLFFIAAGLFIAGWNSYLLSRGK